ncbi:MAG: hypothetical protein BGO70_01885 [Bacteroidetes bacterium 43-93]|nr:four helix bundle protein [Bacteroidota bacterium]OJW96455.1 MAG: hypothetical protein BGO70_01885 [Bacteroidetes bacterium 43-93]
MTDQTRYKGFKDLQCWQEARILRQQITATAKKFPAEEKYLLQQQMIRAARSVTATIAEGYGRFTYADTRHFFIEARGSVAELLDHLTVAEDDQYLLSEQLTKLEVQCEKVFKLINGYISYLDNQRKGNMPANS